MKKLFWIIILTFFILISFSHNLVMAFNNWNIEKHHNYIKTEKQNQDCIKKCLNSIEFEKSSFNFISSEKIEFVKYKFVKDFLFIPQKISSSYKTYFLQENINKMRKKYSYISLIKIIKSNT